MKRLSALQRAPLVGRLMPGRRAVERDIRADVERVAEQLEISPLLKRKPGQLSGGQRQRVAVGRAIVRQPRAFLFDEPLSNLDAKLRVHMRAEIAQLHRQLKTTFIYVTHDQAEAMTMSGRIAVMIGGELIQVGTPSASMKTRATFALPNSSARRKSTCSPAVSARRPVGGVGSPALRGDARARGGVSRLCPAGTDRARRGQRFSGTVAHLENLGSEAFVHIASPGLAVPVVARVNDPAKLPSLGSPVDYGFAPDAVRVFDTGGKRVAASVASRLERPREMAVV